MYCLSRGGAEKKADGTVIVHDQDGKVAATLQKSFLVSDGSVNHVDYDVNGDTVVVKYSSPLVKGKDSSSEPRCRRWPLYFHGGNGWGTGHGRNHPYWGTGVAVAGVVVSAGAASGHAGYTCGKAAKGR